MLAQYDDEDKEHVIAYASRRTSNEEQKYSATELEYLGVIWAVKLFRPYLLSTIPFTIITDHSALTWLINKPNPLEDLHAG